MPYLPTILKQVEGRNEKYFCMIKHVVSSKYDKYVIRFSLQNYPSV